MSVKRHLAALAAVLLSSVLAAEELPVLRVVNWTLYIDADRSDNRPITERSETLREFMAQHRCRVDYIELDTEEEINAYVNQHLEDVDMVIDATEYHTAQHDTGAWLAVTPAEVPELEDLRPVPKAAMGDVSRTTRIPYLWSTSGILYRADLVPAAPTSWEDLIACPRSAVLDSALSVFTVALRRRGVPLADPTPEQLRGAARDLREWMGTGRVRLATGDLDAIEKSLVTADTTMALMWSGDARRMIAEHPGVPLRYIVPKEGGELTLESWLINPRSPHKELAIAFARHLLSPSVQARIGADIRYGISTNAGFAKLVEEHPEVAADPTIEPPAEVLARCEDPSRLNGPDCQELWNRVCAAVTGSTR